MKPQVGQKIDAAQAARRFAEAASSSSGLGWLRLVELLKGAAADPTVDGPARDFLEFMLEFVQDAVTAESADVILAEIEKAFGATHGEKGGRPKNLATWREWRAMFEDRKRQNRIATDEELYEDVAAAWAAAGHKEVSWRGIKNALWRLKSIKE